MRQRRLWTAQQDKVLKYLKDEEKIKKWSTIAKMMLQDYQMPNRSGKQCRERYFNHLDSEIKHQQWTQEEQRILWQLHSQYGNRWTLMTNQIKGRSQNCIKNHFYSKLRKAVRRLNKIIIEKFKTQYKQIKTSFLYKILESAEEKFRLGKSSNIQNMDKATSIKNRLFMFDSEQLQKVKQYQVARALIIDIQKLQQKLKIQSRRQKNASGFLDPRAYNKQDHSFESQDNLSVYSSSFNTSFQPSDQQSQVFSHSQRQKSVRSKSTRSKQIIPTILDKNALDGNLDGNGQNFIEEKMQEQEKSLRYTWAPPGNSSKNKAKEGNNLLGSELAQSLTLRPSKSQKTFSIQVNVEDKVSEIGPIKKTNSGEFDKCISEIAKYQNSLDDFDFNDDDFFNAKSDRQRDDYQNFFDDPSAVEFKLRVFSPRVPSEEQKMIDEMLL